MRSLLIIFLVFHAVGFGQSDVSDTARIKTYGQAILNHEILPSDNEATFECLKSIVSCEEEEIPFYFEVFKAIANQADGSLSEVMGIYTMDFLSARPVFFLRNFEKLKTREKQIFIGNMAYEFYVSPGDYQTEITHYYNAVINIMVNKKQKELLESIQNSVTEETIRMIRED